jgi:hypothetical protein
MSIHIILLGFWRSANEPHVSASSLIKLRTWSGIAQSVEWRAMGWWIGVGFPAGVGILLSNITSRSGLGILNIQFSGNWGLSPGVKQLECEAHHSPPASAQVKNVWSFTSTPPTHLHGVVFRYRSNSIIDIMRFEVFMAMRVMMFFRVLVSCRFVGRCQRSGEMYCLHLQPCQHFGETYCLRLQPCQCFGETYCLHLQPWRWRQYVSPKHWHLLMSLHGVKTLKNIIIIDIHW